MKRLISAFAVILGCSSGCWAVAPAPLTTLRAVTALSNAEAEHHIPVAFEATVIYFNRDNKVLNVQEDDEAIFVRAVTDTSLVPGDRVLVKGTVQPSFLPYVVSGNVKLLGHGTLPKAVPATYDDLVRKKFNCRFVRVRGIIRAADLLTSPVAPSGHLELLSDGGYIDIELDSHEIGALKNLLDANVEITGAAGRKFDGKMQETGAKVKVSSLADIKILSRPDSNPWSLPVTSMDEIVIGTHIHDLTRRLRVHGTITYYQPGSAVVLQNGSSSLWISTQTSEPLQIGDIADASGFPDTHDNRLTLAHAEVQDSQLQAPVPPISATWQQLAFWGRSVLGGHEYDLVSIDGRLVAEVREATLDEYVLVADGREFTAIYHHPPPPRPLPPMPQVPLDSTIRVTGICVPQDDEPFDDEAAFDILMRSFDDIQVVARPSMLNVLNMMIVAALLLAVVLVVGVRSLILERKVRRQTAAVAYLEKRRRRILEDINGSRPLAEIVEQITEVVSFKLRGAPCWCEIAGGARLGNCPPSLKTMRLVQNEIPARSGTALGTISAAFDLLTKPRLEECEALSMGAGLATLAIETRRLYSDLLHRSEFDLLTDIQNRFSMERSLDALIQTARQTAGIFGLIYIDLDDFKLVNDKYGHHVGDLYLQEAASRMKRQLRPGDILARLGGDEFAVLVPVVRSRVDVEEIALRLERCFDEIFAIQGYALQGSASVGIALYPADASTMRALLRAADAAMYLAKNSRKTTREMQALLSEPDLMPEGSK
jgi:diguanylate cyclase (GGDEF)-like protein